jgi:hypothetical protein
MDPRTPQERLGKRWEGLAGRRREQLGVLAVVVGAIVAAAAVVVFAQQFNDPVEGRKVMAAIVIGLGGLVLAIWVLYGMLTAAKARPVDRQISKSGLVLAGVDLRGAVLPKVVLRKGELTAAQLAGADLRFADLRTSSLVDANLRGADLRWADLSFADLRGSDLRDADLRYANLDDVVAVEARFEGALFNAATQWSSPCFTPNGAIFIEEGPAQES